MTKHFKFRSLMSIIYALIMLLPVTSVAFRCAYTIFNKNAYESYYGETINEKILTEVNPNSLEVNNKYNFSNDILPSISEGTSNTYVYVTNVANANIDELNNLKYFLIKYEDTGRPRIRLYDNTNTQYNSYYLDTFQLYFDFELTNVTGVIYNPNLIQLTIKNITYNKYSYLDNAFEYSLHEFIGNNGRGVLNLTDWFTSVFLQSSTHTQLYLDFINWYMNYTLLVSCVYILYLVLMWFVSLARRLLTNMIEKGGELK